MVTLNPLIKSYAIFSDFVRCSQTYKRWFQAIEKHKASTKKLQLGADGQD